MTTSPAPQLFPPGSAFTKRHPSRRGMLAGLGVGSLGLIATSQISRPDRASADTLTPTPQAPSAVAADSHHPTHQTRKTIGDSGANLHPGPFYVQATCELSDDYFLTDDVLIGADDTILPFLNPSNSAVEAIVLAANQLAHLHRDPTTTSGWRYTAIEAPLGVSKAAVAASAVGGVVIMALGADQFMGRERQACQLRLASDGSWSATPVVDVQTVQSIAAGATSDGALYFYGWQHTVNTTTKNDDYIFVQWSGTGTDAWTSTQSTVFTSSYATSTSTKVLAADLSLGVKIGGFPYSFAVLLTSDVNSSSNGNVLRTYRIIDGQPSQDGIPSGEVSEGNVAQLLWSYVDPKATVPAPAVLWQTNDGDVHFVDDSGAQANLLNGGGIGDGQVAAWNTNGEYTFALLDDSTVNIVDQFGAGGTSGFTLPIPILDDVDRIYGLPTDASESVLFAVDVLGTLNVLSRGAAGWTQTQVHQDGATMQSVTCWDVAISVLDANDCAVPNGEVQVSTDRPVGMWQQPSGSTMLVPGAPVTLNVDGAGRLVVGIPTDELDCAVLTVQALDPTGAASGSPFTVIPDVDVQGFLAGSRSLTAVGKLTGDALSNATVTNENGQSGKLFPHLTGGADAVAQAFNHVAQLGMSPAAASAAVQSAKFDLTASTPTFQTSSDPNGFASLNGRLGDDPWWERAKNDVDSVFHGLRHGAIKFKKMVSSWDKDAAQWVVNLTVDIGDGLDHLVSYVITDVKSAVHAISSFFQALGADLKSAWEWLRTNVIELLKAASANAHQVENLFGRASTEFSGVLGNIKKAADGWFVNEESTVKDGFDQLITDLGVDTPNSVAPPSRPTNDTGSDILDVVVKGGDDIVKIMKKMPAWWLYHKITSHLASKSVSSPISSANAASLATVVTDLETDLTKSWDVVTAGFKLLHDSVGDKAPTSGQFGDTQLAQVMSDLEGVTLQSLQLCDALADTALDAATYAVDALDDVLAYEPLTASPLIKDLLDLAGIDTSSITVTSIVSVLIAYPATLVSRVALKSDTIFPTSLEATETTADAWGTALSLLSGVTQTIWAFVDEWEDVESGVTPKKGEAPSAPDWMTWFDVACPLALAIFGWPSSKLSSTQSAPPLMDFSHDPHSHYLYVITTLSILEPIVAIIPMAYKDEYPDDPLNVYLAPLLLFLGGAANIIVTAFYLKVSDSDSGKRWELALGNMSYLFAWLGIQELIDASEGISLVAKLVIDSVANFGLGLALFSDMVDAAGI